MKKIFKKIGLFFLQTFNINIPRKLNGRKVIVPVRSGMKVSLSPEKWMSEILKKILNYSDGTFLDIGVNMGQTLIKLKSIEPNRDYIGIEPNPSCVFYLQHLVSSNQWQNIKLIPTGLYPVDCLLSLVGGKDTDPASTIIHEFKISSQENSRVLKLVPLLSFSTIQKSIPHQNISIIKIDTEGAEFEVMESLTETIKSTKPIIILEVWHNNGDPFKIARTKKLSDLVHSLNYTVFSWNVTEKEPYYTDFQEAQLGEHSSDNYVLAPYEKKQDLKKILST